MTLDTVAATTAAGTQVAPIDNRPLVYVRLSDDGYVGCCREHGGIAHKDTLEDAHLAAARHIARVHLSGEVA